MSRQRARQRIRMQRHVARPQGGVSVMAENSHIGSSQRVIKPLLPATSFRHVLGHHAVTVVTHVRHVSLKCEERLGCV